MEKRGHKRAVKEGRTYVVVGDPPQNGNSMRIVKTGGTVGLPPASSTDSPRVHLPHVAHSYDPHGDIWSTRLSGQFLLLNTHRGPLSDKGRVDTSRTLCQDVEVNSK